MPARSSADNNGQRCWAEALLSLAAPCRAMGRQRGMSSPDAAALRLRHSRSSAAV
eukprot:CAMPEP_0176096648 /NCGR_PEP_ID=MMETSP0120_2-20121206/48451_1 /TAXON_ID=160619 /ORGANISM="Kryptoperidinium foliaceum, Strain CCMP 1326" /LENGTH=54 /DNA_ID=CAMNT_0017430635 /DNA_START=25 /DNA_END=186 /DNA_ORIENTATION=-